MAGNVTTCSSSLFWDDSKSGAIFVCRKKTCVSLCLIVHPEHVYCCVTSHHPFILTRLCKHLLRGNTNCWSLENWILPILDPWLQLLNTPRSLLLYFVLHDAPHVFSREQVWTAGRSVQWLHCLLFPKPITVVRCAERGLALSCWVWRALTVPSLRMAFKLCSALMSRWHDVCLVLRNYLWPVRISTLAGGVLTHICRISWTCFHHTAVTQGWFCKLVSHQFPFHSLFVALHQVSNW